MSSPVPAVPVPAAVPVPDAKPTPSRAWGNSADVTAVPDLLLTQSRAWHTGSHGMGTTPAFGPPPMYNEGFCRIASPDNIAVPAKTGARSQPTVWLNKERKVASSFSTTSICAMNYAPLDLNCRPIRSKRYAAPGLTCPAAVGRTKAGTVHLPLPVSSGAQCACRGNACIHS